jgi:hypothetical protein
MIWNKKDIMKYYYYHKNEIRQEWDFIVGKYKE